MIGLIYLCLVQQKDASLIWIDKILKEQGYQKRKSC